MVGKLLFKALTFASLAFLIVFSSFASAQVLASQGKPAIASSSRWGGPSAVTDGKSSTRWGSEYNDAQWIYVDLGNSVPINRVVLNWEVAFGKAYQIQVSDNATTWTTIFATTTGDGELDDISVAANGRYVRMNGIVRGTVWGYSLWEFQVWSTLSSSNSSSSSSSKSSIVSSSSKPSSSSVPFSSSSLSSSSKSSVASSSSKPSSSSAPSSSSSSSSSKSSVVSSSSKPSSSSVPSSSSSVSSSSKSSVVSSSSKPSSSSVPSSSSSLSSSSKSSVASSSSKPSSSSVPTSSSSLSSSSKSSVASSSSKPTSSSVPSSSSSLSSSSKSSIPSSSSASLSSASSSAQPLACNNNSTNYPICDNNGLAVVITEPKSLLTVGHSPVKIKGRINRPDAVLILNGNRVNQSGGVFEADVTVQEGYNTIIASATYQTEQVTDSIAVSLDLTPPYVTIDSHIDGQQVSSNSITVTGLVNDIVRGTIEAAQAQVRVNNIVADVSNRSYSAKNVSLVEGTNQIKVTASDQVGNTETKIITVRYSPPLGKRILQVSGQNQTASIGTQLTQPLVVKLLNETGQPVVGASVVFRVVQDSGVVAVGTAQEGRAVIAQTNSLGQATTTFKLGLHTGTENNKVRAVAVGYEGDVLFSASAATKIGNKLSINSGNNQRGVMGQVLTAPLVTVVTDEGTNVVSGARVRYESVTGGGSFDGKQSSVVVVTDSDGRATARFYLGDLPGLDAQQVRATLIDSPQGQTIVAGFSASAFKTSDPGQTRITGVVLDNQDQPIPGVTLRVEGTTRKTQSDAQGQFVINSVPVGPVHLVADGSTASVAGEFPNLSYHLVTIAGADNPLSSPIYMVKLNTKEAVYAGKQDVVLTLEKFPGFKLEIPKNSVTFPDGSREGYVSVTAVNASAVPMAPPNGMQPQFIVTIQPTNTRFDPPARLSLPNVDGHAPGAQIEMFSYDHDLEEFVAIGLGSVSEDGSVIRSNPGVGVVKAGWHCGAQPGGSGTGEHCATCKKCDGTSCVNDPAQKDNPKDAQIAGDCNIDTCGGKKPDPTDKPTEDTSKGDCHAPGCNNGSVDPTKDIDDKDINDKDKQCKECKSGSLDNRPDNFSLDKKSCCINGESTPIKQASFADLGKNCPNRVQDTTLMHPIDGCSGPGIQDLESNYVETVMAEDFEFYVALPVWGAPQSGVGWNNHSQVTLACNKHDVCYQTCDSNRNQCDNSLVADGRAACAKGYPLDCPANLVASGDCPEYFTEQQKCLSAVGIMYDQILRAAGQGAWEDRQIQHCNCCGE